ncbi:membrane integrity-associated transporter subunit PqiC [Paracoccus sp. (in: a-proteobacteria)]|uniref:PqiC family protein n=1 Tax=Paracoccus sp. TaxID=267 RepID=UPI0026DFB8FD|nr:PqiC family protein [Paracoccus sp. (in: a-proteobacteria)]MDO5369830.1 PqiC family protein [Paracoccus sp. (in: a-proteobacteria)]
MRLAISLLALAALAGCSNPEKTARFLIDPPTPAMRVANNLGTAELADVSLPEYAGNGEIAWQTADGAVRSNPRNLWADVPERAFTLTLARAISDMSGATVIAEPWPLAEPPRRRLLVRVEKALAQLDGVYRLSGRYYVSQDSAGGTNHARNFDIAVPIPGAQPASGRNPPAAPAAIAAAQNAAIAQLAAQIATLGGPGATVRTSAPRTDPIFTLDPLPPLEPLPELEPLG